MDFEDLIPKKDSGEDLQPPVAAASVNFEDLVPGELEETSVLSIGNPYREQRGANKKRSIDYWRNANGSIRPKKPRRTAAANGNGVYV